MDDLITDNLTLVHYICNKVYRKYSALHEYEDIAGAGMIGLVKAAKSFKPELGYQFSTYACRVIEVSIMEYVRRVGAGGRKLPVKVWESGNSKVYCSSLNERVGGSDSDLTLGDLIDDEQDFTSANVDEFISNIDPINQKICKMKLAGFTQRQIANEIGFSQGHISRRINNIRQKYMEYASKETA